ncbi:RimK family alpha-L-glutamate ligase [Candidatus Woesearchaeota archaeon]|nr:RimK family alpha-L-glutamate ligase [Candidatus Woesearchaeota archaeon]
MKLAVVGLGGPGGELILERAKQYFDKTDFINIKSLKIKASSSKLEVFNGNKNLEEYDCVYLRGSYKYELLQTAITKALHEKVYVPFRSSAFSICHNKLLTLVALQKKKVPIPETYFAATTKEAKKILEGVNYPIIVKVPSGSQGKGVMFADSLASARSVLDALETFNQPYIVQEYVESGSKDVRVIVTGDKVVASMERTAVREEIRANIHLGGVGKNTILSDDEKQMVIKAANAVGADVCGVDLIRGNKTVVLEVNTSPGMEGVMKATKKDVPGMIAQFLHEKSVEFKTKKNDGDTVKVMNDLKKEDLKIRKIMTNLNVKAGMIKLPSIITKISGFNDDDDVIIEADKGTVKIKRHSIKRGGDD